MDKDSLEKTSFKSFDDTAATCPGQGICLTHENMLEIAHEILAVFRKHRLDGNKIASTWKRLSIFFS